MNSTSVTYSSFQPSPAMRIFISQWNEREQLIAETTWKRNEHEFATYEETVVHVMLTTQKDQPVLVWRLTNGKFIDEAMLDRMVADKLMTRRAAKRSMYSAPTWTRRF